MSDIQQTAFAMQRLVYFISTVANSTLLSNNTGAVTTMESNCHFCWVRPNITTGVRKQESKVEWRQTRPLVGEGAPQRQHSNVQTEYDIWSRVPEWTWHHDILTDWSSVVT
jgi:hypothetical protein